LKSCIHRSKTTGTCLFLSDFTTSPGTLHYCTSKCKFFEKDPDYVEPDSDLVETLCMEGPNQFKTVSYKPTCPHGYTDCVWDPAYIHATYPNWYKKLCGDTLPKENPCEQCPNGERYDDEDK
jgi:hypothetical protein